jgi:hypothetical protein
VREDFSVKKEGEEGNGEEGVNDEKQNCYLLKGEEGNLDRCVLEDDCPFGYRGVYFAVSSFCYQSFL